MHILKVWCLPQGLTQKQLKKLFDDLIGAMKEVPELVVKDERGALILFPADLMTYGLGTEIYAEFETDGIQLHVLREKSEKTVRLETVYKIKDVLARHFRKAEIICRGLEPRSEAMAYRPTPKPKKLAKK